MLANILQHRIKIIRCDTKVILSILSLPSFFPYISIVILTGICIEARKPLRFFFSSVFHFKCKFTLKIIGISINWMRIHLLIWTWEKKEREERRIAFTNRPTTSIFYNDKGDNHILQCIKLCAIHSVSKLHIPSLIETSRDKLSCKRNEWNQALMKRTINWE